MLEKTIYIDNNATTPLDERVLQAMLPYLTSEFGNASSATHAYGWTAKQAVEEARKQVAQTIGAEEGEVVFTSGATDAINRSILGVYRLFKGHKNHFVTVVTEHKAVLDAHHFIEKEGAKVTYLGVDKNGFVDLKELEKAIDENTAMVSVMFANNETGVIQDVKNISNLVHAKNSIFFCDAVQALGKIPVNVNDLGIDIMPLSAHKIYGPKGIGALYTRRKSPRVKLPVELHEGTANVPAIVGFAKACSLLEIEKESKRLMALKNELVVGMKKLGFTMNVVHSTVLPNTINLRLNGIKTIDLMKQSTGVAFSLGSACNSGASYVLKEMGFNDTEIASSFRISLGRFNTQEQGNIILSIFSQAK